MTGLANTPPPASSPSALRAVLAAGGPQLAASLERTERRLAEIAVGHGAELGRHAAGTLVAGGKRLRPVLVFLCAGRHAGDGPLRAAVAVELVHMATLVHDDVLDRAVLRRGRPTVFSSGGRQAATTTGDFLFARAFAELVGTGEPLAIRALAAASGALARGELMQRDDAWADRVSPERYLQRAELKTARLFEAACRLGSVLGEPGPELADGLGAFGRRIGVAFQIFDDVLDISGPAERTGKLRGADLLDGTITLPLILARDRDPALRELDLRDAVTRPAEAEAVCERIAATGALARASALAREHVAEAKAALAALPMPPATRPVLELVADSVVERYA